MTELRLNLRWQGCPDTLNLFGDFAEAGGVAVGVAAAFFVGDDGEAFAEDAATSVNGVHRKSLKRGALGTGISTQCPLANMPIYVSHVYHCWAIEPRTTSET